MTSGDVIVILLILGMVALALYTIYSDKIHGRGCGGCSGNCHSGCSCGSSPPIIKIEDDKHE